MVVPKNRDSMDQRSPLRVVVGEDEPLFRAGLVLVLREAGFDVVAAGSVEELVLSRALSCPTSSSLISRCLPT
jgi:DNA-binding NarL/FixJ family response regulator